MKKLTLVAIFMAFATSLVADEFGNTIDFKSITPTQTPQSATQSDNLHQSVQQSTAPSSTQALENALTPQNSFQGVPQNSTQNSLQNSPQNEPQNSQPSLSSSRVTIYESGKEGDFDFEFGVGYVMGLFSAEQSLDGVKRTDSSGTGHGIDAFFSGSYYAGESWGVVFGLGTEIINIDWDEPLYELFCYGSACTTSANSNDLLMNLYFNFGLFKNVWEGDNKGFLRVFGGIGFSYNWLSGGFYERVISCSTYTCNTTLKDTNPVSIPFTLGLRYMFVESHGLELVGKYDLVEWDFSTRVSGISGVPNFNTTISRNLSLGLRYIYKF